MRDTAVTVRDDLPFRFVWKGQQVSVLEIADAWRETGRWWNGEDVCEFFLIVAANGSFLLCRDLQTDLWYAKPVQ